MADSQDQRHELPNDRGVPRPNGDPFSRPQPPLSQSAGLEPPVVPSVEEGSEDSEDSAAASNGGAMRWIAVMAVAVCGVALALASLRGCRREASEGDETVDAEKAKQAKLLRDKPEFEELVCLGAEPNAARRERVGPLICKPGHWTSLSLSTKANRQDVDGRLELHVVGRDRLAARLGAERFTLWSSQPAVLPKGQERTLEAVAFVPPARAVSVEPRLMHRALGRELTAGNALITPVAHYQYHCVVLARTPSRYAFLRDLPSFGSPHNLKFNEESQRFYRLVLLDGEKPSRLPSHALYWTSIACVFWDGADPQQLTPEQQTALLDWLHWGGLLVVSGPDSLEALRGSFLEPYLPVASTGECKLSREHIAPLSDYWGRVAEARPARTPAGEPDFAPLVPLQSWPGITWRILPEARELPYTGGQLAERRVGRGRVVASRFLLAGRDLATWPRLDGWVNGCLLRRPPRAFSFDANRGALETAWADESGSAQDPKHVSGLRYLSREATVAELARPIDPLSRSVRNPMGASRPGLSDDPPDDLDFGDSPRVRLPEGAAWTDSNEVASLAGRALHSAARIQVPSARFVVWALAAYLIVLVPVNWAVFRTVRRVEWAWAAAPLIAIVATVVVVRMAQLDIGFARSQTEICLIEMQPGYSRAHVTRYTALYASLFTRYRVAMDDAGAQVQPFAVAERPSRRSHLPLELRYQPGDGSEQAEVELRGFDIDSNSTDFLHSEQMGDLGGGLLWSRAADGAYQLTNRSELAIRDAVAVHAVDATRRRMAHVGEIPAGATVFVRFGPTDAAPPLPSKLRASRSVAGKTGRGVPLPPPEPTPAERSGRLDASAVLVDAAHPARCEPGEFRLIGLLDHPLAGQRITPAAPQVRRVQVLVAHLGFDFGSDPQRDRNTPTMVDPSFRKPQTEDTSADAPAAAAQAAVGGTAILATASAPTRNP